jgi:hypothetical protein
MDQALLAAANARRASDLSRRRAAWTRTKARRERRRAEKLRDECGTTFGASFARQALEDVGPIFDDTDLDDVVLALEDVGNDLAARYRGIVTRPLLRLVPPE